MRRRPQRQESQTVECRECDTPFNLAAQYYYDNLCPSCKRDDMEQSEIERMESAMDRAAERGI